MNRTNLTYPAIILTLIAIILLQHRCSTHKTIQGSIITKTDTLFIPKIIKIKEIKQVFVNKYPKAIDSAIVGKDTLRSYNTCYTDSTGVVEVTVKDSVNGKLLNQVVDFYVKPRDIKYQEKVITNTTTIKQTPNFSLSAGINTSLNTTPAIGIGITVKDGTGWGLDLGYNSNKQFIVGIKKDILKTYK